MFFIIFKCNELINQYYETVIDVLVKSLVNIFLFSKTIIADLTFNHRYVSRWQKLTKFAMHSENVTLMRELFSPISRSTFPTSVRGARQLFRSLSWFRLMRFKPKYRISSTICAQCNSRRLWRQHARHSSTVLLPILSASGKMCSAPTKFALT